MLKDVGERVAWRCTGSFINSNVITAHRHLGVQKLITFNLNLMLLAHDYSRKMFSVVNSLLGKDSATPILSELDDQCAVSALCTFFQEKILTIAKLRRILLSNSPLTLLARL